MAITKIHAVKVRLGDAINYIENPDKTDGQELISGYNTAPQTAVLDFSVTAAMARKARNTSAKKQGNLAYHMIQSFSPDDAVTPERAHELGRKLAMEFTDGKFEFVVATHINKDSIHIFEHSNHLRCQAMQDFDIYQATGRLEREANFFAADLLLDDEDVLDLIHSGNTDFFSVSKELCIPAPFFAFKMYSLIRRGEHLQLPVDIDNRFLRAKH